MYFCRITWKLSKIQEIHGGTVPNNRIVSKFHSSPFFEFLWRSEHPFLPVTYPRTNLMFHLPTNDTFDHEPFPLNLPSLKLETPGSFNLQPDPQYWLKSPWSNNGLSCISDCYITRFYRTVRHRIYVHAPSTILYVSSRSYLDNRRKIYQNN